MERIVVLDEVKPKERTINNRHFGSCNVFTADDLLLELDTNEFIEPCENILESNFYFWKNVATNKCIAIEKYKYHDMKRKHNL